MQGIVSTTLLLSVSLSVQGFSKFGQVRTRGCVVSMAEKPAKGAGFNYDPSNYKDSNSGNYRRLSDQLAAAKAEEEKLKQERDELLRKESMAAMLLKQEADIFFNTPNDKVVATSDKFFIDPSVLQVIADLDNQLIGLKPVISPFSDLRLKLILLRNR